ncbi:MAG: ANTAR domain-containing protein, partial [Gammaproteobacteria bacterium]|nr:ANTAR domain-containing protein [Gammaproteobacteria bacterium]
NQVDRSELLSTMLEKVNCHIVGNIRPDINLLSRVLALQPDIIIIDIELPDRDILENLRNIQVNAPKPMIMFSQDEDSNSIRQAIEAGISAYVVDDVSDKKLGPVLDAAIASFKQYQNLRDELDATKVELKQRKTIDKAKGILMKQRNISEEEAYQLLRKSAMNQNMKIADVANNLISAAELLGA